MKIYNYKLNVVLVYFAFACWYNVLAQSKQSVYGFVKDKFSLGPLPGATVVVDSAGSGWNSITDLNGFFKIDSINVGRHNLFISYMGYETQSMFQMEFTSGKELRINAELTEKIEELGEVVITATKKGELNNEMALVSSRTFSVDETGRFAGSFGDPARMVSNYAGVTVAGDDRNDIIIRGNAPIGLLWQVENVRIHNPNHFGQFGSTGGPISILNNNLLDNSDFMMSAFPAEYGNCLSGVFDLKMRQGNFNKREHAVQFGLNGLELMTEGPFVKGKRSSYMASYRYSTLEIMSKLGINFGVSSVPQYQDGSFKIVIPGKNPIHTLSVFGLGGTSFIDLLDEEKEKDDWSFSEKKVDIYFKSDMMAVGATHQHFYTDRLSGLFSVSGSGKKVGNQIDSLDSDGMNPALIKDENSTHMLYNVNYKLNYKMDSKNHFRTGMLFTYNDYTFTDSSFYFNAWYQGLNSSGTSGLWEGFIQWQHRFNEKLLINTGVHYQYFDMNKTYNPEPRISLQWSATPKTTFSFGAGLHSQTQPLIVYLDKTFDQTSNEYVQTNKNLDLTKAIHSVMGLKYHFGTNLYAKIETYYQYLYNVPVASDSGIYSSLNFGAEAEITVHDNLVNSGFGENYGVELTMEKYFSDNYYFLIAASLFDSKYTALDDIKRNTAFNSNFQVTSLGGYEFSIGKKVVLTIDGKVIWMGGKRYIPIDLEMSKYAGTAVYDFNNAYSNRFSDYFRLDAKLGLKFNGKNFNQLLAFDVQNITNRKNFFQQVYNPITNQVDVNYQFGLFPVFLYKIQF